MTGGGCAVKGEEHGQGGRRGGTVEMGFLFFWVEMMGEAERMPLC